MNSIIKNFCLLTAIVISTPDLIFAQVIQAQAQAQVQVQVGGAGGGGFGIGEPSANDVDELIEYFQVQIEDMQNTVSLDETQTGKLTLAAKAVSKKVFGERKKLFQFRGVGQPPKSDQAEVDSLSDEDAEASENRNPNDSRRNNRNRIQGSVTFEKALNHKLWKKSLTAVMTTQQLEKLEQTKTTRRKKVREVAVSYRVMQLAEQLRLRQDQMKPLTEIVDRIEGDDLVKKLHAPSSSAIIVGNQQPTIEPDDVREILSESQLSLFTKQNGSEANPLGGIGQMVNQAFGINSAAGKNTLGVQLDTESNGVVVKSVVADSIAATIGIMPGDTIDAINGDPIDSVFQFKQAVKKAGIEFQVTIIRDGETLQLEAK